MRALRAILSGVLLLTGLSLQAFGQDATLVNIAPLATFSSRPGGVLLRRSTDAMNGSGYSVLGNDYLPSKSFYFRFSEAQPIRRVRFALPPNFYALAADTTGSGNYDTVLLSIQNGPTSFLWGVSTWTYGEWSGGPLRIFGLKLDQPSVLQFTKTGSAGVAPTLGATVYQWSTDGIRQHRSGKIIKIDDTSIWLQQADGEGWGWGSSGWIAASASDSTNRWEYAAAPTNANPNRELYELEIYGARGELSATTLAAFDALHTPVLEANVPLLTTGPAVNVTPPAAAQQYFKGMYIEVWMMDLPGWIRSTPRGDLRSWPGYQSMLSRLKKLSANVVWLMPVRSGFSDGVYNSDWYDSEVLWPSTYIAHSSPEDYLAALASALHADGIKLFAGDRPNGWVAKDGVAQSDVWRGAVSEMTASGIDGVAVVFDEGGNQASQDQLNQYAAAADAAHALNPAVLTITNLQVPSGSNRTFTTFAHSVAVDLLGTEGYFTLDDPWGHWAPAFHTAEMIGANPRKRTIITQNTAWAPAAGNPLFYETFTPTSLYGPPLSVIFHGGDALSYWRLNFQNDAYTDANVSMGYAMLDTLSSWGGREAVVPDDILVLETNRQANRFVYYDYVYHLLTQFPDANKTGYYNTEYVFETLLREGLPYHVGFVDYPSELPDLGKLKVIVLPFAYSTPEVAFPQATIDYLQAAAARGVKLIILHRPGSHAYYTPFTGYETLIQSPNVSVVADDFSYGLTPSIRSHLLTTVLSGLGSQRPTFLNAYGRDIELALLDGRGQNAGNKYLLVTNWETSTVSIDVGVTLPQGSYQVTQRDLQGARRVSIGGRSFLSSQDLAKFRVTLGAGEARIFYISVAPPTPAAPSNLRVEN
jgi:hypothetical protein